MEIVLFEDNTNVMGVTLYCVLRMDCCFAELFKHPLYMFIVQPLCAHECVHEALSGQDYLWEYLRW